MGRRKKTSKPPHRPSGVTRWWSSLDDVRKSTIRRSVIWTVLVIVALCAGVVVMKTLEARVLRDTQATPMRAVRVRLVDKPDWMPASLVRRIAADIAPRRGEFLRGDLTRTVNGRAERNPWIAKVHHVEKRFTEDPRVGLVEVKATYRGAIARIMQDGRFFYVDGEGVRLPAGQVPKWTAKTPDGKTLYFTDRSRVPPEMRPRRIPYVMIDGVRDAAPPVGGAWKSGEVETALRLVRLIRTRPYASEFSGVDVRNFNGRITRHEPHLRLYAQRKNGRITEIRFGKFPDPDGDHVISPERKMSYLDEYVSRHGGKLAGFNTYLDLRYDSLHVSLN